MLFAYLGVQLADQELSYNDCYMLILQLERYLDQWKNKSLSFGGKIQLVNWVLLGKLLYWFHSIHLPMGVIKKAKQVIYHFIWAS